MTFSVIGNIIIIMILLDRFSTFTIHSESELELETPAKKIGV